MNNKVDNYISQNSKNKGMFLEYLVIKTIDYYISHDIAWFEKKKTPVKYNYANDANTKVKLLKSTIDFYGIYKGKYVALEAKTFEGDKFLISNLKAHQKEHLKTINRHQGHSYLIIYSEKTSQIYLLNFSKIENLKIKSLSIEWLNLNAFILEIEFPGIVDFLKYLV
ncbi:Holliday junction resolvase RecU [Mycoplasmopsis agassizii]|uniref:Holliday junction resolvase RecU n=1 Tax=Mycoplasmopsis agassizii TaxID=33922 RepID=A0ABX4H403_9BACT|nr:Holliday junction resolvase RecU [Mycoplasmopsis agassizii]PAF54621.1 hypothetical protein CJF60_02685 [Mycoplasmopsis agassizii]SMC16349.1 recombination protein U [Mycoplasmopsis agassizii]